MSEQEAISICKNIIRSINGDTCYMNYSKEQDKEAIETLLDLYHKQKQEAEHYRAENSIRDKCLFNIAEKVGITEYGITESMIINAIDNNYISKDKIRNKIKELEELPQNQYVHLSGVIDKFKELLEE